MLEDSKPAALITAGAPDLHIAAPVVLDLGDPAALTGYACSQPGRHRSGCGR